MNNVYEQGKVMIMEFEYRNWEWDSVGKVSLPHYIFDAPLRKDIIFRVIRWQRAKSRSGTHSTKTISMISGTTRKPWGQKETGKARQGSLRSPQFRGGAVIFGPHPRDYEHKLNKKVRALGIASSLCFKFKEGLLSILNDSNVPFIKTSAFSEWLKARSFKSVLFVVKDSKDSQESCVLNFKKCLNNVPYCDVISVEGLNVLDIVKHKNIIFTLEALSAIEERFKKYNIKSPSLNLPKEDGQADNSMESNSMKKDAEQTIEQKQNKKVQSKPRAIKKESE